MVEPTFRTLEVLARLVVLASGARVTYSGEDNVPGRGGAVVAINHTSFVDFGAPTPAEAAPLEAEEAEARAASHTPPRSR